MKYNKLVRDKIPEIIKENGDTSVTHIASEKEYEEKLKAKLREEVEEFLENENEGELIDILEVINAICEVKSIDKNQLEEKRKEKYEKRGGFKSRIILEETK